MDTDRENAATPADVGAWRRAKRATLVARRESAARSERARWSACISEHLLAAFELPPETVLGFCWPYKSEYDARSVVSRWRERGVTAALPQVLAKGAPLQFRTWWPCAPMRCGAYDIPEPDDSAIVVPDVLLVPMNGFDARGYRLGYGGGYFDATLEALERRAVTVGVSYDMLRMETIYPQPYDVAMDFVVTESGVRAAAASELIAVSAEEARQCFAGLLRARRLPRASAGEGGYSSPVCYASEFPGYFGE